MNLRDTDDGDRNGVIAGFKVMAGDIILGITCDYEEAKRLEERYNERNERKAKIYEIREVWAGMK